MIVKHFNFKCPICGNTDFVELKEPEQAMNWDVVSQMNVYGCTKCYYLLHFSEEAVNQLLYIEERSKHITEEIENNKKEIARLEEESNNLEAKIKSLIDSSSPKEEIEKLNDLLENDIKQRIKLFYKDIERLENGGEDNEHWPPYSNSSERISFLHSEISKLICEIRELKEELEKMKNSLEEK